MKDQKKNTQTANEMVDTVNSVIELSQETANVMLDSTIKTADMATGYYRDMVKVGLDMQETGVNIAKNYFDNMAKINRSWINLFAETGEKTIKSVGENVQKPINDMIANGSEVVENAAAQAKSAAK